MLPMTVAGLVVGLALTWAGNQEAADVAWTIPAVVVAVRLTWAIVRDLLHGELGVDLIAILAIVGALLLGEPFAAAVIGVMLATGEALERYAQGRAHRELTALLGRAPRHVQRYVDGRLETTPIEAVVPGDLLAIRPGEVVPVDGMVVGSPAVLDELALTGESRQVTREEGSPVSSGTVNAGSSFDLRATAAAADSAYAGIVRLVKAAQTSKAPFVRLADQYALIFVPFTLAIAGAAWLVSGDPVRALAVLVVATPCPLLLAAPIAIVAGISRAARRGVIVKGGGPLETLARARVVLFDKTGTLTAGRPRLATIDVGPATDAAALDQGEVLRLAASVEQLSPHVLAGSIVHAARERGLDLSMPDDVVETPGAGVSGLVDGRRVAVGTAEFCAADGGLPRWARDVRRRAAIEGSTCTFVRIDDTVRGALVLDDPLRSETPRAICSLRRIGFTRIVMVTGDNAGVADIIGSAIGVDAVLSDRVPSEKVDAVHAERSDASGPIVMVGDGLNDAPALALADVGVAMGARGASASSEAADIVIAVDRLDRLTEAVQIARRARSIAVQSVVLGMGMSIIAMGIAALGFLPVIAGAILQEAIDVAVILERAACAAWWRGGPGQGPGLDGDERTDCAPRTSSSSRPSPASAPRPTPSTACPPRPRRPRSGRSAGSCPTTSFPTRSWRTGRSTRCSPPRWARTTRPRRCTGRTRRSSGWCVSSIAWSATSRPEGPSGDDRTDLQRLLYGLEAILRLHQAQEEDLYLSIGDSTPPAERPTSAAAPVGL